VRQGERPVRATLVRIVLSVWGLDDLAEDGALVVTELVANAAQHTDGELIRVSVNRPEPGLVRIDVADRSRVMPRPREAGADDEGGRGLALVDALTTRWGTEALAQGKRVWGEPACEAARGPNTSAPGWATWSTTRSRTGARS
jgi:serine/threonine-protein kinase RsbW